MKIIKSIIKKIFPGISYRLDDFKNLQKLSILQNVRAEIYNKNPNAILLNGFSVFSQVDEDGIIEHIYKDIGERTKVFVEIGCGDGLENNTHYLALKGWCGLWVDGSSRNIDYIKQHISKDQTKLLVEEFFVTPNNVLDFVTSKISKLDSPEKNIDFLSVDIDSCDYEITKALLPLKPRVICVEYNPDLRTIIDCHLTSDDSTSWDKTIYQGSSLRGYVDLLADAGYCLVSCNISGYNAFFVKKELLKKIEQVSIEQAYQPPREYLIGIVHGHKKSFRWLNKTIS